MKPTHLVGLTILIVLMLAATLMVSAFYQPLEPISSLNLQNKVPPLQIDSDLSEIGSTTGILVMGVVIVLIISAPLLLRKKKR